MQGCCNDIACFGLHDSLEIYDQAIRRVYRQGVTGNQVRIHRILTLDTVDAVMVERLRGKMETQDEFLQALKKHAKV
jgi:SNF2 family DNA or RNA helicase